MVLTVLQITNQVVPEVITQNY